MQDSVAVRDSKDRSGPILAIPRGAWSRFVSTAGAGKLDHQVS
ncbi:DUF397 domain-containing protein [Streptomyces sp. NPDC058665]